MSLAVVNTHGQFHLAGKVKLLDKNFLLNQSPLRIFFPMIIQADFSNRNNFFFGGKCGKARASFFVEVVNFFGVNADARIKLRKIFGKLAHGNRTLERATEIYNLLDARRFCTLQNFGAVFRKIFVFQVAMCIDEHQISSKIFFPGK